MALNKIYDLIKNSHTIFLFETGEYRKIMTVGIYGIFDSKTDECLYIGMSKNIEERWKSHLKLLKSRKHPRKDFVEWFYGNGAIPELLKFTILEECENEFALLNAQEIKWFHELMPKFYGKKPSLKERWEHSAETKRLIKKKSIEAQSRNLESRICSCGESFETYSTSNKKYCTTKCGKKARYKKYRKNITSTSKMLELEKIKSQHTCYYPSCDNVFYRYEKKKESKKYFCSYDCSSKWFYDSKGITKEKIAQLYYEEKLSLRQIAKIFDCSHQSIKNFIRINLTKN